MHRVILDLQSYVMSDAIKSTLENGGDFNVAVSERPQDTTQKCFNFGATAVIMEVTGYTPYKIEERLKIRDELRKKCPNCKIVLLVDENAEKEIAEQVKNAKRDGYIDMFLFGSTSASFLMALIDTM